MDIRIGDIVTMKKPHPCGNDRFEIVRTGLDLKLKCIKCGRLVEGARSQLEKKIKTTERNTENV